MAAKEIILPRPDDFHLHLRDGESLASLGKHFPTYVKRAIIMPNLVPPVVTTQQAADYRDRILKAMPGHTFQPLMTLYLTDSTTPEEIAKAVASGIVFAVKLYPAGATTNSDSGVTDIKNVTDTLKKMEELGLPLCVHGEVTDTSVDIFEREPVFLERILNPLVQNFPKLKIILEHITTKEAVEFVKKQPANVAATITCHHLLYNRNEIFRKGLRPHAYCLPVLKHENDRKALIAAIQSGNPKFFLGSDSAPHPREKKESERCCAGCFTAHAVLELYTLAFDQAGCLNNLKKFACENGANFYGLPLNTGKVVLREEPWTVPASYEFGSSEVVPIKAGETLKWKAELVEP